MTNNKVILLLSGGFDSGLAGYLLEKVGYSIVPLHLSSVDFAGEESIEKSKARNPAFDVTPAKYIKGIITEKGIVKADEESFKALF